MHLSAKEDASAIATRAKVAGDQGLALFSYCTRDGFERLGANIFTVCIGCQLGQECEACSWFGLCLIGRTILDDVASKMLSSARSSLDDPTLASNHGHTITGLTTNRTALEFASGNSNTWVVSSTLSYRSTSLVLHHLRPVHHCLGVPRSAGDIKGKHYESHSITQMLPPSTSTLSTLKLDASVSEAYETLDISLMASFKSLPMIVSETKFYAIQDCFLLVDAVSTVTRSSEMALSGLGLAPSESGESPLFPESETTPSFHPSHWVQEMHFPITSDERLTLISGDISETISTPTPPLPLPTLPQPPSSPHVLPLPPHVPTTSTTASTSHTCWKRANPNTKYRDLRAYYTRGRATLVNTKTPDAPDHGGEAMPTANLWINAINYGARCCVSFVVVFATVDELSEASRDLRDALNLRNDSICDLLSEDSKADPLEEMAAIGVAQTNYIMSYR
ncbi:hypothetical protein EDC04DRAFT_2601932 [Pisolithus marmoratus]|nr:hypothetical protein EDC04DRAFT_2601932 [Pisolithus marmoratus]